MVSVVSASSVTVLGSVANESRRRVIGADRADAPVGQSLPYGVGMVSVAPEDV